MTLPLNSRLSALYDTNGTQKDFGFGFRVFFDPDNGGYGLEVRRQTADGYEVIPKSDYLVLPVEDNSAGVVRFSVAPSAGQQIYIAGKTPTIQQLVLTNFGRYSAESIETQFDFITAIIQEWLSALGEETRQRIAANDILTQYVVQRIDDFVQQVNQNWDDKSQEIEDYIATIMPSFTQTLREEIEAFAVAGMQDAIDQTLAESKAEIDDAVARANAAALAAAITGKLYDTPEAGVDPVTGVQNGAYYNVRSSSDESYVDEYQNIGGVPTPSGKRYLSALGVQLQEKAASTIQDASGKNQQEVNDELKQADIALTVNNTVLNYTDGRELSQALVDSMLDSNNLTLNARQDGYTVSSNKTITLQRDTVLDLNNQKIDFTATIILTAPLLLTTALSVNSARYATSITLNSADGINAGDLLYILTSVIAETQWNYRKQDCVRIKSISGNTVELEEPLQFAYSTLDSGLVVTVYKRTKLTIKNPNFYLIGMNGVGSGMFDLQFLSDIEIENPVGIGSRTDWNPSANELRRMFRLKSCFNISVNNAEFFALSYPILMSDGARNLTVSGVKVQNCRHSIETTSWAKNAIINNLVGSDNYASISAHPAFDVQYNNAVVERDQMLPNLRCVRGELNNVKIHTLADNTSDGPYFHSLSLSNDASYLYDDADLSLDRVRVVSPNRTRPCLGVYRARNVFVSNCSDRGFVTSTNNGVTGNIYFGVGNTFADKQTPKIGVGGAVRLNKVRVIQNPLVNAELKSGVYDLNLRESLIDQSNNYIRSYGSIVSQLAGDQTVIFRVHTNCFTNTDNVGVVNVNLKLKAALRHSNAGFHAFQERHFNFMHRAFAPSSVFAPLDPIYSSAAQGIENESLEITIPTVTQMGRTEVGANGDFYIDIAISLISGKTSPVYNLNYELELSSM